MFCDILQYMRVCQDLSLSYKVLHNYLFDEEKNSHPPKSFEILSDVR